MDLDEAEASTVANTEPETETATATAGGRDASSSSRSDSTKRSGVPPVAATAENCPLFFFAPNDSPFFAPNDPPGDHSRAAVESSSSMEAPIAGIAARSSSFPRSAACSAVSAHSSASASAADDDDVSITVITRDASATGPRVSKSDLLASLKLERAVLANRKRRAERAAEQKTSLLGQLFQEFEERLSAPLPKRPKRIQDILHAVRVENGEQEKEKEGGKEERLTEDDDTVEADAMQGKVDVTVYTTGRDWHSCWLMRCMHARVLDNRGWRV